MKIAEHPDSRTTTANRFMPRPYTNDAVLPEIEARTTAVYVSVTRLLLCFFVACASETEPQPDAVATPDACVHESGPCCALLPDRDAVGVCVQDQLKETTEPGTCGVYICWQGCILERINFCIP